jgi:hypothetical protein
MIERRLLTKKFIEKLETGGAKIGNNRAPQDSGWIGQPNKTGTNFVPYSVVAAMSASSSSGPITNLQADWELLYSVSSFGVSPEQCEWMADASRIKADLLRRETLSLGDARYRVALVTVSSIGAVQRIDAVDPPYWGESDVIVVRIIGL